MSKRNLSKSAYHCPFCSLVYYDVASEIVRHCKKSHGKVVKATDCLTHAGCKKTEWFQQRKQLADKFKKGK
jgi:hypothetical protein